MPFVRIIYKSG